MIRAEVVLDSVANSKKRVTTFSLTYPRFIHAELMTHRAFSRNASSSRAIPIEKMIKSVIDDPAMPIHWGKNQKGMSADEELGQTSKDLCIATILRMRDQMAEGVKFLSELGLHKQVANRYLEPWQHMATVLTATEWGNFFNLRFHAKADPNIQALARQMLIAMKASQPKLLSYGQWHLPYVTDADYEWVFENVSHVDKAQPCGYALARGANPKKLFKFAGPADGDFLFQKMSAARCARVSYKNHEGNAPSLEEDLALFERLMGEYPKHASPTEHQATPAVTGFATSGNLVGWTQYRKLIPGEYAPQFDIEGTTP